MSTTSKAVRSRGQRCVSSMRASFARAVSIFGNGMSGWCLKAHSVSSRDFPYFAGSARAGSLWLHENFVRTLGPNSDDGGPLLGLDAVGLTSG